MSGFRIDNVSFSLAGNRKDGTRGARLEPSVVPRSRRPRSLRFKGAGPRLEEIDSLSVLAAS